MSVVEARFSQLLIENEADPDIRSVMIDICAEPTWPQEFLPYPFDPKGYDLQLSIVGTTVFRWAIDTLMHRRARQPVDADRQRRELVEARIKSSLVPGHEDRDEGVVVAVLDTVNRRSAGDAGTEKLIQLAAKAHDPAGYLTDTAET
jgi:hypothetical protein